MSAQVNEIFFGAAVAAVRRGSSLRVYETDVSGGIREAQYEGKWTGGSSSNIIATGKIGTPVAATNLEFNSIRVYYVGTDNKAKEAAYDSGKGWYNGDLSRADFSVAPYSSISAVFLGGHSILRVYGQLPNDTIQEWCWDNNGKWTVGTNLGAALPGSSIAATTWGGSPYHIRVYYQDAKLNLVEKAWDGKGWYQGGFHVANKVPRAPLGVTSWGEGNSLGIRVYYGTVSNVIKEKGWDGSSGGWYDGGFSQESVPGSRVCAIPLDILRVYIQNGTLSTAVTEFAWEGKWVVGKDALPPA
ncbi:hypothetical protein PCL_05101 [Purpureocillium lilacinum]|uniref:Uncharacterized protein n=1 Tax=Purpureocillium lilacinum TaxID=33203 RepID=A0A2U3DVX0_PURLI|nr:hypothetical protein PCL_05101 [Purpureocillium lilacinum]GJN74592.1 hypothetical protein PLICBS_008683 [Purpureocillium lilacinum]